jgi:hypothetical protein
VNRKLSATRVVTLLFLWVCAAVSARQFANDYSR